MTHEQVRNALVLSTAALGLTACGGSASSGINAISTPPVALNPTPAPSLGPPPVPAGPIGLQSNAPFSTVAAYNSDGGSLLDGANLLQFSYTAATGRYTITIPGFETGQLVTTGGNGSYNGGASTWLNLLSTTNDVTLGSGSSVQQVRVVLQWPGSSAYTYTQTGNWFEPGIGGRLAVFAYGIPTAVGDVPLSGTATYAGSVRGLTSNAISVGGSVALSFDFGAGSLSGVMKPTVAPTWDTYSLGDYTFRDTAFAKGSTSFSGAFSVSGSAAPSSFSGSFNGPQAAELMANWTAPYLNPETKLWGAMSGAWIAKKP